MKNKKVILFIAGILILVLTLSGCGEKEKKPLQQAVSEALSDTEGLMDFPLEELEMAADITQDEFSECVYLVSEDGISAREVIVIRAANDEKATDITQKLEAYLTRRQNETRDYLPDAYTLLKNARVERKGNTVALIVGDKASEETKKLLDHE